MDLFPLSNQGEKQYVMPLMHHPGPHTQVLEYKDLSLVWGVDRTIRPEDHCLASLGLPNDARQWSRGTDFSIHAPYPL